MNNYYTKDEIRFLKTILEDLEYLTESWQEGIEESKIRRDSVILRRLLLDGGYGNAWRKCGYGKEPKLKAAVNNHMDQSDITFYQSGGAVVNGIEIQNLTISEGVNNQKSSKQVKEVYTLSNFLKSCSLIYQGQEFNKRQIIQFVCNKLGGAHYDDDEKKNNRSEFKPLRELIGSDLSLIDKNTVYLELLSIGQAFSKSKDIEKLIKKIKEILKEHKST